MRYAAIVLHALLPRKSIPSNVEESVRKLLYLAHRDIAKKWTMLLPYWAHILNQLVVYFQDRVVI